VSEDHGPDPLEGASNEEVVAAFWNWAYRIANDHAYPGDVDDVAQEVLVELWRTLESKGGKAAVSATYLATAGRHRANEVLAGAYPLGYDSRPGPRPTPRGARTAPLLEADGPVLDAALEGVEVTALIDAAVEALSERDEAYVRWRFWHGMSDVEIAAAFGTTKKIVGQNWHRRIKPLLIDTLAELAPAA
jgi:RNA polymerase sigma factor (sigma-70 family)